MNKSISIKMIISLLTIIFIISVFCSPSSQAIGDMMSDGKAFLSKGNSVESTINTTALKSTSDYIYNTLLAIAIIVAVIVAMVLGIQFMIASADEKAKVKEALMPFVAGCIVVFGSFTIWKVAVNIGNSAESEIQTGYEVKVSEGYEYYESWEDYKNKNGFKNDNVGAAKHLAQTNIDSMSKEELKELGNIVQKGISVLGQYRQPPQDVVEAKQQLEDLQGRIRDKLN